MQSEALSHGRRGVYEGYGNGQMVCWLQLLDFSFRTYVNSGKNVGFDLCLGFVLECAGLPVPEVSTRTTTQSSVD